MLIVELKTFVGGRSVYSVSSNRILQWASSSGLATTIVTLGEERLDCLYF